MEDIIKKEIFKTSSLGEYIASNETLHFFNRLSETDKVEINDVFYGDPKAYSGYKVICIECLVKDSISFNDNTIKYHNGDRIFMSVNCNEEDGYEVGDTFIEQVIGDYDDFIGVDYVEFDKGYYI